MVKKFYHKWYDSAYNMTNSNSNLKQFYIDMQMLYRKYLSGEFIGKDGEKGDKGDKGDKGECVISPIPPANPPTYNLNLYTEFFEEWGFEENFTQNWFINNQFSHLFTENFTWVEQSGEYAQVLQETFQQDWFIFNQYGMNIAIESFENNWFTINNYNSNIFVENWEEGGW